MSLENFAKTRKSQKKESSDGESSGIFRMDTLTDQVAKFNSPQKPSNVSADVEHVEGMVIEVPIEQLITETQVRGDFNDILELAKSIETIGLLQYPVVIPNEEGKYLLLTGERRVRAHKYLEKEKIKVVVHPEKVVDDQRVLIQLTENIQRSELTPFEIASGIDFLVSQGMKKKDVAERLGYNTSLVSHYNNIFNCHPIIKKLYQDKLVTDLQAMGMIQKALSVSENSTLDFCEEAIKNGTEIYRRDAQKFLAGLNSIEAAKKTEEIEAYLNTGLQAGEEFEDGELLSTDQAVEEPHCDGGDEVEHHNEDANVPDEDQKSLTLDSDETSENGIEPQSSRESVPNDVGLLEQSESSKDVLSPDLPPYKKVAASEIEVLVQWKDKIAKLSLDMISTDDDRYLFVKVKESNEEGDEVYVVYSAHRDDVQIIGVDELK